MKDCISCGKNKLNFFKKQKFRKKISIYTYNKITIFRCKECKSFFTDNKKKINYFEDDTYRKSTDPFYKKNYILKKINANIYNDYFLNDQFNHYKNLSKFSFFLNKKVLDFGCGTGSFVHLVSNQTNFAAGIEASNSLRKIHKIIKKKSNLHIFKDFLASDKINKRFDIMTCFSTIEHISNVSNLIKQFKKRLAKNGTLLLGCVNSQDYRLNNNKYHNIFFRDSYCSYFSEYGLKKLLTNNGFTYLRSIYKERYNYDNYLKYKTYGKYYFSKKNYTKIVERKKLSDYMYLLFKKN
jgi:2-polyprenyl-3-methyl-5-hydroxy-6-metoxy-1,4-benzoquinol methylase